MTITILGSGTSHGIPVVGCECQVCRSANEKNKRTRASVLISNADTEILVDTATEFRLQAVREGIKKIDGILYTHSHADHLHGLDDIRPLSRKNPVNVFASEPDLDEILNRFPYIFNRTAQIGGGKPQLRLNTIDKKPFTVGSIDIQPIAVKHGILDILGYRINDKAAYVTDCSFLSDDSLSLLENLDVLIIGALRYRPHATHFNIDQALGIIKKISPGRAYLTHLSHDVDHDKLSSELPGGTLPAFDGLKITL